MATVTKQISTSVQPKRAKTIAELRDAGVFRRASDEIHAVEDARAMSPQRRETLREVFARIGRPWQEHVVMGKERQG